jgi:phosphohistidine phosphatase
MERGALGLKELVPVLDVLAASPYKRALETAEIIAGAYGGLNVERIAELAPGAGVERVVAWLIERRARGTVAVVGHEPDLSRLVCTLLAATNGPFLELRKGAACLLEFPGPIDSGAATLDWFLGPKHLRRLADCG